MVTSTKLCVWSVGYLGDVGECSLESLWHRDAVNIEVELCLVLSSGRQSERYADRVGSTTNRQLHIHTIILIGSIIIVRHFASCSVDVKIILFKAYCIGWYDAGLWKRYKVTMFNKLSSCYNKCLKLLFGYRRRDSVTQILFNLGIPEF